MGRRPDSRASVGQQIEDRLDAVTDEMRRQSGAWIKRMMRAHPSDDAMLAAVIGGVAGGILDLLWEQGQGDPEKIRIAWASFGDGYLAAMAEDAAAETEAAGGDNGSD